MQNSNEIYSKTSEAKFVSEIKQLSELGVWCTPEFLIQSSQSVQSIARTGEPDSRPSATASGRYFTSSLPLAAYGQAERVIRELRDRLDRECEAADSADVLQLWMSVERSLTSDEHRQLFPAVLERIFPESKAPAFLSRDSAQQLGGH